ncbi:hypothetical protein WJX73_008377 [Symbiochloris irregularis]|uniref:GH18 domain-containing protein n=1 Tax=Symbiochloris irregularis TaxID=706552 RepID=A0AAW1NP12_9CHLO
MTSRALLIGALLLAGTASTLGQGTDSSSSQPYLVEYIGAKGSGTAGSILQNLEQNSDSWFTADNIQPYFILAFAREDDNAVGSGNFVPHWDSSITPADIASFKTSFTNVKFLVSLGGATLTSGANYVWQPQSGDCSSWIAAAAQSVSALISEYHLDGIDIDFENFESGDSSFPTCIAGLINSLQSQGSTEVSIAPFPSIESQYAALYKAASSGICFVNFQAYAQPAPTGISGYESLYNSVLNNPYPSSKLLLGVQTSQAPSDITSIFQDLYSNSLINGAFFFEADDSAPSYSAENSIMQSLASSS